MPVMASLAFPLYPDHTDVMHYWYLEQLCLDSTTQPY